MRKVFLTVAGLAFFAVLGAVSMSAQGQGKVRISGQALNFSNTATGANTHIQIDINSWSTQETRKRLIDTFLKDKQDGLLEALQDMPSIGRWTFPGYMGPDPNNIYRLGTPLRYAMSTPLPDGGQRIIIMTDRVIGFREQANQPRSIDYPFTLMQIQLNKNGEGEGRMAWSTKIDFDKKKNNIEIENYASEPIRLNLLKLEPRK